MSRKIRGFNAIERPRLPLYTLLAYGCICFGEHECRQVRGQAQATRRYWRGQSWSSGSRRATLQAFPDDKK